MHVATAHPGSLQELLQFFRHSLGQGCHQYPLVLVGAVVNFFQQVVNLIDTRTHLDDRVEQTGRSNHLLHHHSVGLAQFVVTRRGTDEDDLIDHILKLIEGQRTVIHGRGQTETVVYQVHLTRPVAAPHRPHLRNGHVAFVDHHQKVRRKVIEQTERPLTGLTAVEITRVVLNARAVSQFPNHFQIELGTFLDALRLEEAALLLK